MQSEQNVETFNHEIQQSRTCVFVCMCVPVEIELKCKGKNTSKEEIKTVIAKIFRVLLIST